jgi:hypothetical protein
MLFGLGVLVWLGRGGGRGGIGQPDRRFQRRSCLAFMLEKEY